MSLKVIQNYIIHNCYTTVSVRALQVRCKDFITFFTVNLEHQYDNIIKHAYRSENPHMQLVVNYTHMHTDRSKVLQMKSLCIKVRFAIT